MAKEKKELIVGVNGDLSDNFTTGQKAVLGLQNTLAMCGVILVPILCGLDVSVTLFCAGIGTIIYQFIDKKMVPAFLGGSFAIIAGVSRQGTMAQGAMRAMALQLNWGRVKEGTPIQAASFRAVKSTRPKGMEMR